MNNDVNNDFIALEQRISQLVNLCQKLHSENQELKQRLMHTSEQKDTYAVKVNEARTRIEALLQSIPEDLTQYSSYWIDPPFPLQLKSYLYIRFNLQYTG